MAAPYRNNTTSEECAHSALVDKSKIYLPPLHTRLGLIKISVKAMREESEEFVHLRQKFPSVSDAESKAGVFVDR
jgi:hypothetical protein